MHKGFAAALAAAWVAAGLCSGAWAEGAQSKDDGTDILKYAVNVPGVGGWSVWNAQGAQRSDPTVQGGYAFRVIAPKKDNAWEAAASVSIKKPVKKGDVIQVLFWARAEVPPKGRDTAILSQIGVGMAKAPYTGLFGEPAEVGPKWKWYFAAGIADKDYAAGDLNLSVQVAAAEQTIDFGPVFVLDYGPDYDRSKLLHNRAAGVAPSASETLAAALTKIQATLPVKGVLISDPALGAFVYGNGQTNSRISVPEIPGGQATRVTLAQKPANPWDVGASLPLSGDIHKGDSLVLSAYVRVGGPAGSAGILNGLGISLGKAPWTRIIGSDVTPTADGKWHLLTVRGVSPVDAKAGEAGAGMQLGGAAQSLDIGPVFVLNLGQQPAK